MSLKDFSAKVHSSPLYSTVGAPVSSSYAVDVLYRNVFLEKKGCRCLEIGIGRGHALKAIEKLIETKPVGIDINPQFVESLKNEGYEVHCINTDNGLPFADESFDIIYTDQVMEHVVSQVSFLDEIRRVLKPNGQLLIGVPNVDYKIESAYYNPVHFNYYNKKTLRYILMAMGFEVKFVKDQRSIVGWKRMLQSLLQLQGGAIYAHGICNKNIMKEKQKQLTFKASQEEIQKLFNS